MTKHILGVVLLTCILVNGCTSESEPAMGSATQESQGNFAWMLSGVIGIGPALNLNGYGCYCGLGNDVGVIPVDETDSCCFTHDHAWMDSGTVAQGCSCSTETYTYTNTNGVITCNAGQNACATYCCEADKAFTACVQAATPIPANQSYDRSQCDPIECTVDEDCEGGTWCNGGRCVPYCGGGGFGFAATACDEEPLPTDDPPFPTNDPPIPTHDQPTPMDKQPIPANL